MKAIAFIFLFSVSSAFAASFEGNCVINLNGQESNWSTNFDAEGNNLNQQTQISENGSLQLSVLPGAAAFADVMSLTLKTAQDDFKILTVLSHNGYGVLVFEGTLNKQPARVECQVHKLL